MTHYFRGAIAGAGLLLAVAANAQPPRDKTATLTKATAADAGGVSGAEVFAANCAACHQATGLGIPGAFPALAKDPFVVGDPDAVAQTLLNGRGGMPSFRDGLNDAQIAAVITHIRSSWGNKAKPVAVALIAKNRAGQAVKTERPIPAH